MPEEPTVLCIPGILWEWFERPPVDVDALIGKYMFFSKDRDLLRQIAIEELQTGDFRRAKTHRAGVKPRSLSGEYVLYLYYTDNSRMRELAKKYRYRPGISHCCWKENRGRQMESRSAK